MREYRFEKSLKMGLVVAAQMLHRMMIVPLCVLQHRLAVVRLIETIAR